MSSMPRAQFLSSTLVTRSYNGVFENYLFLLRLLFYRCFFYVHSEDSFHPFSKLRYIDCLPKTNHLSRNSLKNIA